MKNNSKKIKEIENQIYKLKHGNSDSKEHSYREMSIDELKNCIRRIKCLRLETSQIDCEYCKFNRDIEEIISELELKTEAIRMLKLKLSSLFYENMEERKMSKPLIYFDFKEEENGNVSISKDKLKEILNEVYNQGYSDGSMIKQNVNLHPNSPLYRTCTNFDIK